MTLRETVSIRKMTHSNAPELQYSLCDIPLNERLGGILSIKFNGQIECIACGRGIKKSFNQGYCYPCFQSLACCDVCIVKPELCHYRKGTCREPEWGEEHCLREHVVYLANTTSLKVGITKSHQTLTRWGDQGAGEALLMAKVPERYISGLLERALAEHVADKTDWRGLIKGKFGTANLIEERERLRESIPAEFKEFLIEPNSDAEVGIQTLSYPVQYYPDKAKTINLDKTSEVSGEFHGIRGQYIFLSGQAINMRKYAGYRVDLEFVDG